MDAGWNRRAGLHRGSAAAPPAGRPGAVRHLGLAASRAHRRPWRRAPLLPPGRTGFTGVRRNVLRQGRLLLPAVRLRTRLARQRQRFLQRRQSGRTAGHPRVCGAPARRQVDDRRGHVALWIRQRLRLAVRRRAHRHPLDPDHRADRTDSVQVDGARRRSRSVDRPSTATIWSTPGHRSWISS